MTLGDNDLPQPGRLGPGRTAPSDLGVVKSDAQSAFGERMNVLIERAGGVGTLSQRSGLSRRVIDKYRAGESDPSRERLVALARGGDASLEWLATGEGSIQATEVFGDDIVALPRYDVSAAAGTG